MKGKFIAFEGCEGVGKSTQIKLLSEKLIGLGIKHIVTREPGGSSISESIRKIILDGKNTEMTDECEALLYAAARVQHLSDTVRPALEKGEWVLCDRYVFSSFAYQGYGRGLDLEFLKQINSYAIEKFMPDVTLFFNLEPTVAFARKNGADEDDRIEQAGAEFHERVYKGYCDLVKKYPNELAVVDCSGSKWQTAENIVNLRSERGVL